MKEKMKGMSLAEKIDYLWTYYKIWLLVPVFVGVVINVICSAYQASQENILINIIVVGAGTSNTTEFEDDFKKYMNKSGKNDKVVVQTNFSVNDQNADTMLAISTLIGAAEVDVFVCPEDIYSHFSQQNAFRDIREILDDSSQSDNLVLSERGDALIINDSDFFQQELGTVYEDVYVAVMDFEKHEEGKKAFIEYALKYK